MFCPGGAGPGGRGYCRSSDVPCTNRDRRMVELVPTGLDVLHAERVHVCVDWGVGYRPGTAAALGLAGMAQPEFAPILEPAAGLSAGIGYIADLFK